VIQRFLVAGLAFSVLLACPPDAAATQSLESVRAAAADWLQQHRALPGSRMSTEAGALDSRLQLADCAAPLEASLPGNRPLGARVSVTVHCPVPGGWTVRVPVRVKMVTNVLVTSRPLARGDGIGAGTVLTPGMLAGRQAVRIGDAVSMEATVEGVTIHADGVALGAGDTGARLKVRNATSGKVLDAIVSGPGTVAVLP
jgi:flagella basal body P-ring formation protein FlgA